MGRTSLKRDPVAIKRILTDTGCLARDLFGYNYDEIAGGHRINVGKGGIRPDGKTQEIIALLDDTTKRYKLVVVSRDGRKSTMAQCLAARRILLNPDIRIFYAGRTDDIVRSKSIAIRNQLMRPEVTEVFGPQQGDAKWEEMCWTVATRQNHGLQNATFTAFSQDSIPTGGRCDLLILDDFIDHTNVATPEQNKKSKERWQLLVPFIANGCEVVILCTPWADDDLNAELRANKLFAPPFGGQIVAGAGVTVVKDGKGGLDLEVDPEGLTFPHLTLDYLREKLWAMSLGGDYSQFVRQYLCQSCSIGGTGFNRADFQHIKWEMDMEQLSGYLLTDTAIGKKDSSCYSVVAYVGLDAQDNIFLLDMAIGHWEPTDFKDQFFDMLEKWQRRVNHCGEAWEQAQLATAYRDAIEHDSRARKTKLRTIEMPRTAANRKPDRIKRLASPFRSRRFFVVDTIQRTFFDINGEKVLWDPVGFYDAQRKIWMPSGELVDEFIRDSSKKDIPDTLAMILEWNTDKRNPRRFCSYKSYRPRERAQSLTEQRAAAYHASQYGQADGGGDWWDRVVKNF